ncbi:MAG: VOC family protein [Rhodobacterales bacterium]|nr:VOC family protein [Rhodobacterales bacterium]NCO16129.1 VOC family protein [Alphaproteobacteria bacterium]
MFAYITIGTNDLARAQRFYDATLATLGATRLVTSDCELGYGPAGGPPRLWINHPFDGRPASVGNGSMPALIAATRAAVDAFHAAALAHGGSDEGAPGLRRYGPDFYAAYLRDPDGNKLSALCNRAP